MAISTGYWSYFEMRLPCGFPAPEAVEILAVFIPENESWGPDAQMQSGPGSMIRARWVGR